MQKMKMFQFKRANSRRVLQGEFQDLSKNFSDLRT